MEWYIDSDCFRYKKGRKSQLREFWNLKDEEIAMFGNNATREIKDYEMITNANLRFVR